jgi:hypothetical protein
VLVDQTAEHPPEVGKQLAALHDERAIRWIRLDAPSIPRAMNTGLEAARCATVLFLDDDILPMPGLVEGHLRARADARLIAGQVLQPGQEALPLARSERFRFNSSEAAMIEEFMGGNFSIDRRAALELGGFDENFVGAAYRFEAEFAHRFVRSFGPIRYEPSAAIRHLAIASGGTRAHAHHLRTAEPVHSVGAYYFQLSARPALWWLAALWRPLRSIRTRHHLRHPWWIPATLLAEARGFAWALRLRRSGPKLIAPSGQRSQDSPCA